MRAVARGLVLKALPLCPERCGGACADPATLTDDQRRHRRRHGCDAPIPDGEVSTYAIRCPRCNGAAQYGAECSLCGDGPTPGFYHMRRCPASQTTPDVDALLTALQFIPLGHLPGPGSVGDQALYFMEIRKVFDREFREATEEAKDE